MAKEIDKKEVRLKVVDERVETEKVMRLGERGSGPKEVARVPVPVVVPDPERLDAPGLEGIGRRTLEPDLDAILDEEEDAESLEEAWATVQEERHVPYGWFVLIILVLVGLVVTSIVVFWGSGGKEEVEQARQESIEHLAGEEVEDEEAAALVALIESTMRSYFAATSIEDLLPLVRDPERMKPLMENWYSTHAFEPQEFERLRIFQPMDINGRLLWLLTCEVEGVDEDLNVLLEQEGDSSVRVDWETQVCYQPMLWDDFAKQRPEGKSIDFRVYAKPDFDGLFSHEFKDEEKWMGLVLTAKDSEGFMMGYVERHSPEADRIIEMAKVARGGDMPMFLRLRIPEGLKSPRGVVVEEILSERWALIDELK